MWGEKDGSPFRGSTTACPNVTDTDMNVSTYPVGRTHSVVFSFWSTILFALVPSVV